MLKTFRNKNVARMVLWALLILILPAFVLWGTGNIGRSGGKGPAFAGTIDGRKVSFEDFHKSLAAVRCQVILNYYAQPKTLDAILNNKELMGKLAWDRLLMSAEAKRSGVRVSDAEIVAFIKTHPIFARDGAFDDKVYEYILRRNVGVEPRGFEEILRQNLTIQKVNDALTADVAVTAEEVFDAYRREKKKFKLICAVFASERYRDRVKIDDARIREYYEAHKEELAVPARPDAASEGGPAGSAGSAAPFDDVKEDIRGFLAAGESRTLALKDAREKHAKILELMAGGKATFEGAAGSESIRIQQTQLFDRNDYLETIGEAAPLSDAAVKLRSDAISEPVEVRAGAVIFRIAETRDIDRDAFEKDKADFTRKVLDAKKMAKLEEWLKRLERSNRLNIDLKGYEKYYR